jgi:hypothetical protein
MFLNVNHEFKVKNLGNKKAQVIIPTFDACVGNPPYIRQELIENKEDWTNLAKHEFGIDRVNQQSDLYVFYLMHTAAFLKEGGRLGYVVSASWLDISFGAGLQKFLLDNFKIIAIIDHQKIRSFETASINTVILIIEKCSDRKVRKSNNVKFVRVFQEYEDIIGLSDSQYRFEVVKKFVSRIESATKTTKADDFNIEVVNQHHLEAISTLDDVYVNGHWGARYLRSPEIFNKIISSGHNKLIPLSNVVEVKYGIKTGANDFFYVIDETENVLKLNETEYKLTFGVRKDSNQPDWSTYGWYLSELTNEHFLLEREFVRPVFKTQREAVNLDADISNLKFGVIICSSSKNKLSKQKKKILKYIEVAESREFQIDKRPSCQNGENWYDLSSKAFVGDFIFPSKIGEKYRLIDNRSNRVFCDKVNYVICVKNEYQHLSDIIFLIFNSITFRYFIDLFSRQLTGSQTLSDVDVNLVEQTLIINPTLLEKRMDELMKVYTSLKNREQSSIHEEILLEDRKVLDTIILQTLGLSSDDVNNLYRVASKYVSDRQAKSESLVTSKFKQRLTYDEALELIKDRFSEVTKYKDVINGMSTRKCDIPEMRAIYPKRGIGTENLFGIYEIFFLDTKKKLSFENVQQLELFRFLNSTLEVKGIPVLLPNSASDCTKVLKILNMEFTEYINQIKSLLRVNRSTANYLSIYRDLLFSK